MTDPATQVLTPPPQALENSHSLERTAIVSNSSSAEVVAGGPVGVYPDRLSRALQSLPRPGETAFGFHIGREIGRGSFGRVYLATQPELAGRTVVLKVSADLVGESRMLAQLQHTNIVPVYSVHRSGGLQAVCMPYFGATTVADLLKRFHNRASLPRSGRELVDTFRESTASSGPQTDRRPLESPDPGEEPLPQVKTDAILDQLSELSYTRAVCWIGARLADGLAHAHARGILHRDVKPANILLTDDGQPMLLDFGIAEEIKLRTTVGGTVPYMSPEQLEELITDKLLSDHRSDIYSLGIVLYEVLAGRYPFEKHTGTTREEVRGVLALRRAWRPDIRARNRDVTPGLESIVYKCLAANPTDRYQTAEQLRDDLDRYLSDQPLAVAPDPSVRERVQKWGRRHPRLSSTFTLVCVALVLMAGGGAGMAARQDRLNRLEAEQTAAKFAEDIKSAQYLLYSEGTHQHWIDEGLARAQAALDAYKVTEADDWETRPAFANLPAEQRDRMRRELSEACVLLARGYGLKAAAVSPPDPTLMKEALRLNALAEKVIGANPQRMIFVQRATFLKRAGRLAESAAAEKVASETPPRSARDYYSLGTELSGKGKPREAAAAYRRAQTLDPKLFWAYFGEGSAQFALAKYAEARGCFTAAVALWPEFHWTYYNRGVVSARLGDPDAAIEDLTKTLELEVQFVNAYLERSLAYETKKDYAAALKDLDLAEKHGAPLSRVLVSRARVCEQLGDAASASRDRATLTKLDPIDAAGWIDRGVAKAAKDLTSALPDFDRALQLDPRSTYAWMYKAYIFDNTKRYAECRDALTQVLAIEPGNATALGTRGVMHARLKAWPEALVDARKLLATSFTPSAVYHAASIYALLAAHDPVYQPEAVTLLGIALRAGYGFELLEADSDLDAIRKTPEYERIVAEAKRLHPQAPRR